MTETATTVKPAKAAAGKTGFVILGLQSGAWYEVARVHASSRDSALRMIGPLDREKWPEPVRATTTFVAVPTRSWTPGKPKAKTTTTWEVEYV